MIRLAARYYDGLTSQPQAVELRLDDAGMLHVEGGAQPHQYPLDGVQIAPRLGSTTRSLSFSDGSKCESDDHEALDELARRAGRAGASQLLFRIESSWRVALSFAVALLVLVVAGTHWGVPVLARRLANAVPPALAYDLGRGALEVFDRTLLKPTELTASRRAEIERAFEPLRQKYRDLPLSLVFRRGVGPNAFALPDGTVIVTDELVALAKNDQEVVSVLSHEVGHVHHRHGLRLALESSTVVLLVSTYLGDLTQLTTLSAALPGIYAQARYSREHETEADDFALSYLKSSGIPPERFASILAALQQASGPDLEHGLQYLASHPPTAERIRRFEN